MSAKRTTQSQCAGSDLADMPLQAAAADGPREQGRPVALLRAIECELVPRLMMLERTSDRDSQALHMAPLRRDVTQLTALLLADGAAASTQFIEALHQRGVPLERIFLDLLAPTARRIVDLWEHRHCDDDELRVSLNALHGILLELKGIGQAERFVQRAD